MKKLRWTYPTLELEAEETGIATLLIDDFRMTLNNGAPILKGCTYRFGLHEIKPEQTLRLAYEVIYTVQEPHTFGNEGEYDCA